MDFIKKHWQWLPVLVFVALVGPSLAFKFTGAPITSHIFYTVGSFLGLGFFRDYGGYIIGSFELLAIIVLLVPSLRAFGALLATGLMSGAVFFHLFSPLGLAFNWYEDAEGNFVPAPQVEPGNAVPLTEQLADTANRTAGTIYQGSEPTLWIMAFIALGAALSLVFARRKELLALIGR